MKNEQNIKWFAEQVAVTGWDVDLVEVMQFAELVIRRHVGDVTPQIMTEIKKLSSTLPGDIDWENGPTSEQAKNILDFQSELDHILARKSQSID